MGRVTTPLGSYGVLRITNIDVDTGVRVGHRTPLVNAASLHGPQLCYESRGRIDTTDRSTSRRRLQAAV
jgi:hypothetical protein